jgi:hypothetical protein
MCGFRLYLQAWPAACGSGGEGNNGGEATPTFDLPGQTPTPLPPIPTPKVIDGRVNSHGVGYEATIPQGWSLRANILQASDYRGDAYFKEVDSTDPAAPPPNISVGCRPILASPGSIDEVTETQVSALEGLRRENIETSIHDRVAGHEARQIDYVFRLSNVAVTPTPGQPDIVLDKRDVMFVSEACVWTISLSAPSGTIEQETPVLEAFLESFTTVV